MSVESFYLSRRSEARTGLRELDRVRLTCEATTDDGDTIEAGRIGTIVGIWREGAAFEIEFAHPVGALATVEAGDLSPAGETA